MLGGAPTGYGSATTGGSGYGLSGGTIGGAGGNPAMLGGAPTGYGSPMAAGSAYGGGPISGIAGVSTSPAANAAGQ